MKLRGQIILCESLNLQGADLRGTTFEMSMSKHSMEAQTPFFFSFSPFFGWSHLFAFPSVSSREKPSERKPQSQGALHAQAKLLLFSHQAFNKAFKILLIIILPFSIAPNTTDFRDSSV